MGMLFNCFRYCEASVTDLLYDVEVTIKSVKGKCPFNYKVGDKVYFDGRIIRGEICYSALLGIFPNVYAWRYGGEFTWGEKDSYCQVCPDPENIVTFEVRRIRK